MSWRMTKRTAAILTAAALGAAALTLMPQGAAGSGGALAQAPSSKSAGPGLGYSKAIPTEPSFALPPGVTLETPIMAWAPQDPVDCDEKYAEDGQGSGDAVALCLIFRNTTDAPITVTLPPGLLFVSNSDDVQNGVIVERITVVVPVGERYFAPVFAHCVNIDRSTTGRGDQYQLGPVVTHNDFQELFALLDGKSLSKEDGSAISSVVHEVAQGKGLSPANRAILAGL